jgi:TrmH family RNA methyltransferase
MLSAADRARFTVVLVGARNPSNIGAAARAMQDFGFSDLRVVNDYGAPFQAAQIQAAQVDAAQIQAAQVDTAHLEAGPLDAKSAVAAAHVMHNARRFDRLVEAIADCALVVATTAIGERDLHQQVHTLQQAAPRMLAALSLAETRVALLFGSEKTGLTNEQLSHCSLLTTIPMFAPEQARHLSMNLGQAVAVCLYELTRAGFEDAKPLPVLYEAAATTAEDRERLTQLLLDVMHATGYTRRFPANSVEPLVRQLTQQLGASHREAMTWMGIFRQVLWRERKEP